MNTTSIPQRGTAHDEMEPGGPGASRSCSTGDGAIRTAQPEGSPLPPALEAPSPRLNPKWPDALKASVAAFYARRAATQPAPAEAPEPGLPGAKRPIFNTSPEQFDQPIGAQGVLVGPDGPLTVAQRGLDGTWTAPVIVYDAPGADPQPDPPPDVAGADACTRPQAPPVDPRQAPLPLPEPWRDGGGQMRLDAGYTPPKAPWRATLGEYVDQLAACWRSVADWLRLTGGDPRDIEYAERRAGEVCRCGTTYRVFKGDCGYVDEAHAVLIEGCDSRTCPRCGRLKAQHYRHAAFTYVAEHPVMREKGKVSRGYALTTITTPKPPVLTFAGIKEQVAEVKKSGGNVWKKVTRFNPRRKDGTYGKYPGKCADAGQIVSIECGPSGNIHGHIFRYGGYHYSEDVRRAAGGHWTHDTAVKQSDQGVRGSAVEALKYATKSSTKPGRNEYVHPALAVMFELATKGRRLIEGYGTMRGLIKHAEEHAEEQRQGDPPKDEAERLAKLCEERKQAPCPGCGQLHGWEWINVKRPVSWNAPKPPRKGQAPPGIPRPPGKPGSTAAP